MATATPALAKPAPPTAHRPMASVHGPLQIQSGRQSQAQPFKPLQIAPHKGDGAAPSPSASPEFNPLKRRHMAMPVVPPSDLAF